MTNFFGSDWHLGHKNILKHQENRKFSCMYEMENSILQEYERTVQDTDNIFLLGDIAFTEEAQRRVNNLPGNKFLIKGNHDNRKRMYEILYSCHIVDYWEMNEKVNEKDKLVVLCHYPIEEWRNKHYGSIHLHGHCHGGASHVIQRIENRYDVGYDVTGKVVATLEEIIG